eukprot:185154-Hanusia_phi.AAC.11
MPLPAGHPRGTVPGGVTPTGTARRDAGHWIAGTGPGTGGPGRLVTVYRAETPILSCAANRELPSLERSYRTVP